MWPFNSSAFNQSQRPTNGNTLIINQEDEIRGDLVCVCVCSVLHERGEKGEKRQRKKSDGKEERESADREGGGERAQGEPSPFSLLSLCKLQRQI